jgi:hypothetical protein
MVNFAVAGSKSIPEAYCLGFFMLKYASLSLELLLKMFFMHFPIGCYLAKF